MEATSNNPSNGLNLFIKAVISGELKKSVGNISQKVLTSQLRNMEKNGLIYRTVYAEVPPRVEYSLTKLGLSLKPILDVMKDWGENYQSQMCNN